jgi:hypothetical protein
MSLATIRSVTCKYRRIGFLALVLVSSGFTGAQANADTDKSGSPGLPPASDEAEQEMAVRYLENIQRHMYLSLGRQPTIYDKDTVERFAERFMNSPSAANLTPERRQELWESIRKRFFETKLRSKYEDLGGYFIVEQLNNQIRDVIASSSVKLRGVPVFGTLPTRRVNARTFAVPGTNNVVIAFEDQLFTFALLFSKAVVYAFPERQESSGGAGFSTSKEEIRKRIETHPEPRRRFQEVLAAYLLAGTPSAAPPYFQAQPHATLSSILRQSMELFILGHEYGHFIGNHLQEGRQVKAAIGNEKVTEIMRSWSDEFEADVYGLQLSVAAMRKTGHDTALGYWGADFFFTMLDSVERALHILTTGKEADLDGKNAAPSSHPPPALRRQYLRNAVNKLFKNDADPIGLAEALQFSTELLWEKTKPMFMDAYKDGRRPHSSWQR